MHIDDEVNARIAKASAAFGRLCGSVWDRSGIRLGTKLKVYKVVVLPTLYFMHAKRGQFTNGKRLKHCHTSCLRKRLKSKWQDRIPDTEVLKRAGMHPEKGRDADSGGGGGGGGGVAWGNLGKNGPIHILAHLKC